MLTRDSKQIMLAKTKKEIFSSSERLRFQQDRESGVTGGTKHHGKSQNKNVETSKHTEEK